MSQQQHLLTVLENRSLTGTVFSLKLDSAGVDAIATPGQFLHIKCQDGSVLRRPVSISDAGDGTVTVVAEVRGAGTGWLSKRQPGDKLDILGPLGRGFDLQGKNIVVVGGGIGVPPMLFTAARSGAEAAILGFRTKDCMILTEKFSSVCQQVYITTDDGSYGEHGTVAGPLERLLRVNACGGILACGPRPMLGAVAKLAAAYHVPCQVSLEERMGCGVGACLVCACRTIESGTEHMRRVCKDGPVFSAEEVVW